MGRFVDAEIARNVILMMVAIHSLVKMQGLYGYRLKLSRSQKSTGIRCLWIRRYMLEVVKLISGNHGILRNTRTD